MPAGSLLVFYGPSNPDYVVALDPTDRQRHFVAATGWQLRHHGWRVRSDAPATCSWSTAITAAATGSSRSIRSAATEDPTFTFNAPFNLGDGGLALDPATPAEAARFGSVRIDRGDIVQMTNTGTILRHVTVGLQAPGNIGVSGIVFDAAGNLLGRTNQGVVLKLNVNADFAQH